MDEADTPEVEAEEQAGAVEERAAEEEEEESEGESQEESLEERVHLLQLPAFCSTGDGRLGIMDSVVRSVWLAS